jgi:hypothetical protein
VSWGIFPDGRKDGSVSFTRPSTGIFITWPSGVSFPRPSAGVCAESELYLYWQFVSQSVHLGYEPPSGTHVRMFASLDFWFVSVLGHPPWRGMGPSFNGSVFVCVECVFLNIMFSFYPFFLLLRIFCFSLFLYFLFFKFLKCIITFWTMHMPGQSVRELCNSLCLILIVLSAAQTLERSYAWPPPCVSLLCFRSLCAGKSA